MTGSGPYAPPTDVVVVLADQWRGQDQGWCGNPDVRTPTLDALAARGVAVRRAGANHPVCGPSRGDLLTGCFPHRHQVLANDLPLAADVPTFGEAFSSAGWRTCWIGKWHLSGLPRDQAVPAGHRGFERFASNHCSHRYFDTHYYVDGDPTPVSVERYEPEVQTDLALDALGLDDPDLTHRWPGGDDDRPALVVVSYGPPHDPYPAVPQRHRDGYDAAALTLRPNTADDPEQRGRQALYYAAITALDEQVGRIVTALERAGRLDSTLIVVLSDHGDMLGAHGRRAKQQPWAESVRIPLVWHWPDGLAPSRPDGWFGIVDVAPTLLELAGVAPLPATTGVSRAAALRSGERLADQLVIGNCAAVDEGWKQGVGEWRGFVDDTTTFARHVDGRAWVLYDDAADPFQCEDLSENPAEADRLVRAHARLDGLLGPVGDRELPAAELITRLGLIDAWNDRERTLQGDAARLLEPVR